MTNESAITLMRYLGAGFNFEADSTALWVSKLAGCTDEDAAWKAAHALVEEAENRFVPGWGSFRAVYDRWVRRHEEQASEDRLAITDGQPVGHKGPIPPSRGRAIAAAAYERDYQRPAPADIFALPDPEKLPSTTEDDMRIVAEVCRAGNEWSGGWMSNYTEMYRAFGRDHLRARSACRAMELARKIEHRSNGVINLLPSK